MEKIEVFELDDDFDPLEELEFQAEEEQGYAGGIEYQVPVIPDADRSIVPDPVVLPPAERIQKLIAGMPGQKFRVLSGIRVCSEPKTLDQAAADLDVLYPQGASVYTSMRIIELLTEAGALEIQELEAPAGAEANTDDSKHNEAPADDAMADVEAATPVENDIEAGADKRVDSISLDDLDLEFDEVEEAVPRTYLATEAGLKALEDMWSADAAKQVVVDSPRYLPVYYRILKMCAEPGGKTKNEVAAKVDNDPLLREPRLWCQYFLEKLREANALDWDDAWVITDIGRSLLASDLFDEYAEEATTTNDIKE